MGVPPRDRQSLMSLHLHYNSLITIVYPIHKARLRRLNVPNSPNTLRIRNI